LLEAVPVVTLFTTEGKLVSPIAWIVVIAVIGLAAYLFYAATPKLGRAVEEASKNEDITPVLEAIDKLRPSGHTAAFNHAIRQLWERYQRPLAMVLIKELAERHGDSLIAQYWLDHAPKVEPKLASEHLTKEFMNAHYRPELAARCGPVG